jgi:hypothetical protein
VFCDANAPFFMLTGAIVTAGGRMFAEGIERNPVATGPPPFYSRPEAVYELSTDGSANARRVFDMLLLHDCQSGPAGGGVYLYQLDLAKETQKVFPCRRRAMRTLFISHALGDQLALAGARKQSFNQFQVATISSVWLMELKSGRQRRSLSFPPVDETRAVGSPWISLVGWLEEK